MNRFHKLQPYARAAVLALVAWILLSGVVSAAPGLASIDRWNVASGSANGVSIEAAIAQPLAGGTISLTNGFGNEPSSTIPPLRYIYNLPVVFR